MTIAEPERPKMTAREYLLLGEDPPGVRLELVNGEIVVRASPPVSHAFAVAQLVFCVGGHVKAGKLGVVMSSTDHVLSTYDVRRPDIYFYGRDRVHLLEEWPLCHAPDLAVEIVSPGSERVDCVDKYEAYRGFGVPYYWIVDPQRRTAKTYKLQRRKYVACGSGKGNETVAFLPFEDLEISLGELWWPRK